MRPGPWRPALRLCAMAVLAGIAAAAPANFPGLCVVLLAVLVLAIGTLHALGTGLAAFIGGRLGCAAIEVGVGLAMATCTLLSLANVGVGLGPESPC